jgi:hypothetical protein
MTDFFKSALGLFGQNPSNAAATPGSGNNLSAASSNLQTQRSSNSQANDFVGQNIMIGSFKLRVTRMLAEGGYAIVYIAQDQSNGTDYALKVRQPLNKIFFKLWFKQF